MRNILFRGKRIDNGEWVEGLLTIMWGQYHIIKLSDENTAYPINPETVCQYTNKSDDNNIPMWEEDFVMVNDDWIGRIIWQERDTAFCVFPNDDIEHETYCLGYYINEGYQVEIIGNIFDNPELLQEAEKQDNSESLQIKAGTIDISRLKVVED